MNEVKHFFASLVSWDVIKKNAIVLGGLAIAEVSPERVLHLVALTATAIFALFHATREALKLHKELKGRNDETTQRPRRRRWFRFQSILWATTLVLVAGCASVAPQKPGRSAAKAASGATAELVQSENPKTESAQKTEATAKKEIALPAGTVIVTTHGAGTNIAQTKLTLPAPSTLKEESTDKTETKIGAAQKDTARELGERIKSMRPVMFFGIAMLLAAGALAYFGWWTKAAIAGGLGIGAIAFAQVLPGHEGAIICGALVIFAVLALLVLYVYHKGKLDRDGDGIPDVLQKRKPPES